MELDELLEGSECEIMEWLRERNLVHECDCGYTVYDEGGVAQAAQEEFGDKRFDEINQWAWNLANDYGWLWLDESSKPQHGIYHCQHCAGSEWSLLMDMEKLAEAAGDDGERGVVAAKKPLGEPCVVFVDESYSEQFPRKADGSMSFAAFIVPESAVEQVRQGVRIFSRSATAKAPSRRS